MVDWPQAKGSKWGWHLLQRLPRLAFTFQLWTWQWDFKGFAELG